MISRQKNNFDLKRKRRWLTVPDLCRKHGMSSASFYKWCSKIGGMDASLMKRMKEFEDENRLLKKMYIEEKLIAKIAKDIIEKKL
jgi:putative transposase